MTFDTAQAIVQNDSDFCNGQYLFARIMRLADLSQEEMTVVEDTLWSMMATAYLLGYKHREHRHDRL